MSSPENMPEAITPEESAVLEGADQEAIQHESDVNALQNELEQGEEGADVVNDVPDDVDMAIAQERDRQEAAITSVQEIEKQHAAAIMEFNRLGKELLTAQGLLSKFISGAVPATPDQKQKLAIRVKNLEAEYDTARGKM